MNHVGSRNSSKYIHPAFTIQKRLNVPREFRRLLLTLNSNYGCVRDFRMVDKHALQLSRWYCGRILSTQPSLGTDLKIVITLEALRQSEKIGLPLKVNDIYLVFYQLLQSALDVIISILVSHAYIARFIPTVSGEGILIRDRIVQITLHCEISKTREIWRVCLVHTFITDGPLTHISPGFPSSASTTVSPSSTTNRAWKFGSSNPTLPILDNELSKGRMWLAGEHSVIPKPVTRLRMDLMRGAKLTLSYVQSLFGLSLRQKTFHALNNIISFSLSNIKHYELL